MLLLAPLAPFVFGIRESREITEHVSRFQITLAARSTYLYVNVNMYLVIEYPLFFGIFVVI